jgi:hypothetical protein
MLVPHNPESDWMFVETDPFTHVSLYIRVRSDGMIDARHTLPKWAVDAIMEDAKQKALAWQGWDKAKHGAVVAQIPTILDDEFKRQAGYDPTKGGWYDKDKYNAILDDSDYRHFRTGGGKIGRRAKHRPWVSKRVKAQIEAANKPKLIVP